MQPNTENPIDSWSDEELFAQYREAFLDRRSRDFGPRPQINDIEEELRRRGLVASNPGEGGVHPVDG